MKSEKDSGQLDPDAALDSQSDHDSDQVDVSKDQETIGDSLEDAEQLAALVRQNPAARELLRRDFQSKKDQGVEQAKKATQEAQEQLDLARRALLAAGVDPNNIDASIEKGVVSKMAQDYLKTGKMPAVQEQAQESVDTGELIGDQAVRTASRFLPPEMPDEIRQKVLNKVRNGYFTNTVDLISFVSQEGIRLSTKPKPNLASSSQSQGEIVDEPDKTEELRVEYNKELLEARRSGQHFRVADLKRKYRRQGLDI